MVVHSLGQWDDMTQTLRRSLYTTASADNRIDGRSGDNLLTYTSPSFNGVTLKAAYQHDHSTATSQNTDLSHYATSVSWFHQKWLKA